ncbi:heterokaryon incompatibility protein-domain-containing protein [Podospora appendiculata]|uniref:Heterokaryon incompatibility protein-domain-containing protein n=1 Tax=Podospora appendiculata TaxID=314037 RepID=A0AAE0XJW6_9PEZI|nr:heterokaryon incompatibility protein-domain-containing protein [Podospora appendiculata]
MKALRGVLQKIKLSHKQPRCGACLFELHPDAAALNIDIDHEWEQAFATSDSHTARFSDLERSASRGCNNCAAIISFLDRSGIQCSAIEWWPSNQWGYGDQLRPQVICHLKGSNNEGAEKISLELCTPPEHFKRKGKGSRSHPSVFQGRKMVGSTWGPEAITQTAKWLSDCREKHKLCQNKAPEFLPTRLICIAGSDPAVALLVDSAGMSRPTPYAALSHRWSAETEGVRLLVSNFEQRKRDGILVMSLPQMMQDAIHVVRELGICYVWIDSLCIIQDSEFKEDWIREAGQMANVYSNAEVTLAATWCHSSGRSLFSDRDGSDFLTVDLNLADPSSDTQKREDNEPMFLRRSPPHFQWRTSSHGRSDNDAEAQVARDLWPLLSRGWVYQEQWLSRRTVHFTGHEVLWLCNESTACECAWYDFNSVDNNHGAPTGGSLRTRSLAWSEIVQEYTERDFTFVSDRMPALAGIATAYGELGGEGEDRGGFLCGMWREDLPGALLWFRKDGTSRPRPRPMGGMPTWSWASVTDGVEFGYVSDEVDEAEDVSLLDARVVYGRDGPFVSTPVVASISVSGQAFSATMFYGQDWSDIIVPRGSAGEQMKGDYGLRLDDGQVAAFSPDYMLESPGEEHFVPSNSPVTCLIFGQSTMGRRDPEHPGNDKESTMAYGLVLRFVEERAGGQQERGYQRIGYFAGWDFGNGFELDKCLGLSQKRQITLV